MNGSKFRSRLCKGLLVISLAAAMLSGCSFGSGKTDEGKYLKQQFKNLYNVKVNPKDVTRENDIYACNVEVDGMDYRTVVIADENGNFDVYTDYEANYTKAIVQGLGEGDMWHATYSYLPQSYGLINNSYPVMKITSDEYFDAFADKLESMEVNTEFFVRASYGNNVVYIPLSNKGTAKEYREYLSSLVPEIEIIPKQTENSNYLLSAATGSEAEYSETEDTAFGVAYKVHYDGTIEIFRNMSLSGSIPIATFELNDYDYSVLITALREEFAGYEYICPVYGGNTWYFGYHDEEGNEVAFFGGYISGSELLEGTIETILEKYYYKIDASLR